MVRRENGILKMKRIQGQMARYLVIKVNRHHFNQAKNKRVTRPLNFTEMPSDVVKILSEFGIPISISKSIFVDNDFRLFAGIEHITGRKAGGLGGHYTLWKKAQSGWNCVNDFHPVVNKRSISTEVKSFHIYVYEKI